MNAFQTIIYHKEGGKAYITLNRPQFLNAYNLQMRDELYQALYAVQQDDEVKVLLLRGAGDKAFCAGADLTEFLTAPSPIIARQVRWERDVWGLFLSLPQPTIAVLHGYVLGSGIEMALCCDLRIASEEVRFGLPEVGLGIIPAAGATQTLPRLIGRAKALEVFLSGDLLDAKQAYRVGLVNQLVPRPELMAAAERLAERIISLNSGAIRGIKEAVRRGMDLKLEEGLELEERLTSCVFSSGRASAHGKTGC